MATTHGVATVHAVAATNGAHQVPQCQTPQNGRSLAAPINAGGPELNEPIVALCAARQAAKDRRASRHRHRRQVCASPARGARARRRSRSAPPPRPTTSLPSGVLRIRPPAFVTWVTRMICGDRGVRPHADPPEQEGLWMGSCPAIASPSGKSLIAPVGDPSLDWHCGTSRPPVDPVTNQTLCRKRCDGVDERRTPHHELVHLMPPSSLSSECARKGQRVFFCRLSTTPRDEGRRYKWSSGLNRAAGLGNTPPGAPTSQCDAHGETSSV